MCFTSCTLIDWYSTERTIYRGESRNTCVSAASSGMSIIDTLPKQISSNCLLLRKPRKSTKSSPSVCLSACLSLSFPLLVRSIDTSQASGIFESVYKLFYLFTSGTVLNFLLPSNPDESIFPLVVDISISSWLFLGRFVSLKIIRISRQLKGLPR